MRGKIHIRRYYGGMTLCRMDIFAETEYITLGAYIALLSTAAFQSHIFCANCLKAYRREGK